MTADELYAMEAETGRTSEWEQLYRAEKRRADAAEAALARVRAMCDRLPAEIAAEGRRNHLSDARADAVASIVAVVLTGIKGAIDGGP